jgi:drug/metabolite transporter (DMT)-like permease
VWGALLVTGLFASALAYLIQVWAQRRLSAARIAIVFSLETVFAGIFGYWLSGDRLGWLGWGGCVLILAGIVVAEPAAVRVLRALLSSD